MPKFENSPEYPYEGGEKKVKLDSVNMVFENAVELDKYIVELEKSVEEAKRKAIEVKVKFSKERSLLGKFGDLMKGLDDDFKNEIIGIYEKRSFQLQDILKEAREKRHEFNE